MHLLKLKFLNKMIEKVFVHSLSGGCKCNVNTWLMKGKCTLCTLERTTKLLSCAI